MSKAISKSSQFTSVLMQRSMRAIDYLLLAASGCLPLWAAISHTAAAGLDLVFSTAQGVGCIIAAVFVALQLNVIHAFPAAGSRRNLGLPAGFAVAIGVLSVPYSPVHGVAYIVTGVVIAGIAFNILRDPAAAGASLNPIRISSVLVVALVYLALSDMLSINAWASTAAVVFQLFKVTLLLRGARLMDNATTRYILSRFAMGRAR